MKRIVYFILITIFFSHLSGQNQINLTTDSTHKNSKLSQIDLLEYKPIFKPIPEQSVYPEEELVIKFAAYNHKGTDINYSFTWSLGGKIDQENKEFIWIPTQKHLGNHPIIFTAIETITNQQVELPIKQDYLQKKLYMF